MPPRMAILNVALSEKIFYISTAEISSDLFLVIYPNVTFFALLKCSYPFQSVPPIFPLPKFSLTVNFTFFAAPLESAAQVSRHPPPHPLGTPLLSGSHPGRHIMLYV